MRRALLAILPTIGACALALAAEQATAYNYVHVSQFGSAGSQAGQLSEPEGVAVDQATHQVYVADAANHRIDEFDAEGHFIAAWGWGVADGKEQSEVCTVVCLAGLPGAGQGQFSRPSTIAVDNSADSSKGDVYVGDEVADRVEKFDADGNYLSTLTSGNSSSFQSVDGVAVDTSGDLWVYDSSANVYQMSETGSPLMQWNTSAGTSPGLTVDANFDVYVVGGCLCVEKFSSPGQRLGELDPNNTNARGLAADLANNRIFSDQGQFVAKYDASAKTPATPLTTFGRGVLQSGAGLAVDDTSEKVYVADAANDEIQIFGPPPPGPPQIEHAEATNVGDADAELKASIYTGQYDTTYRFEYGASTRYGSEAPAVSADIGSGIETVSVDQVLTGLTPDTVYHYRVIATNSHGEAASSDGTFLTFNPSSSTGLPDGRVYELVSPPDKNGGDAGYLGQINAQAALSGEAVTYGSLTSFSTSQSAELLSQYLSIRTPQGWVTQGISPPANPNHVVFSIPYDAFSADLSEAVLAWTDPALTPDAPVGKLNLYLRDNADGTYRLITTVAAANGSEPSFVGASSDYQDIVFQVGDALTRDAAPNARNVYEWSDGQLSLVSLPPGSSAGAPGAGAGDGNGGAGTQGAVSSDGSLIFFTVEGQLYVRKDGAQTVKINASRRTPSLGDGNADFLGATPDGAHVLFSDETPLTSAGDDNGGLYEVETATGNLTAITPDSAGNPGLQGVVGYSDDGDSIYFVATGELAAGATLGRPNLYLSHHGALTFIATLSTEDEAVWTHEPTSRRAAVSPDGSHVVFPSNAELTGYDNTDASTGKPDSEVFEYNAATQWLHCVSCNPSGEAPVGAASIPTWLNPNYNPHYLSEDGNRVFFDSSDSLVPRDTNGEQDVYEWERGGECEQPEGCIYLISSGGGETEALFADATPNGSDVFFTTASRLVPEDTDEDIDLYDARVHGGFPATPAPTPCSGEVCQGPPSAAPVFLDPPTVLGFVPENDASTRQRSTFTFALAKGRAAERLLRAGKLLLHVHIHQRGRITASVTSRIRGHAARIAFRSVAAKPGTVALVLELEHAARSVLGRRHSLRVAIDVSFTGNTGSRRLDAALQTGGPR